MKQPTANKKEVLKLKKAIFSYNSKITEKPIPTKQERERVIDYFKQQGFELYKTEDLKPKLDKLSLIESQTRIVKQYENKTKQETEYLLNMLKKYQQDSSDKQKGYVINP